LQTSVEVKSNNIHKPTHFISARGITPSREYSIEALFEPQILEMYHDAKEYMKTKLKEYSGIRPELKLINLGEVSTFGRLTGFFVNVDNKKLGISSKDISARNKVASEIYSSLEEKLRDEFDTKELIISGQVAGGIPFSSGNTKYLALNRGLSLETRSPLNDEVNSGTLYFSLNSNEHGSKELHNAVLEFMIRYINEKFVNKLENWKNSRGAVNLGLGGDGSGWRIDLSNLRFGPKLAGSVFGGYLPDNFSIK
jgi:hypothetical protein